MPATPGVSARRSPTMTPSPRLLPLTLLASLPPHAMATPVAATGDGGSYVGELLAILLPLAFIIVFLLVLLRMLRRRFGLAGPDAPLSVVQVLPVGPRERIVVLRSRAGRAFAVGVSANAVTLVSTLDDDDLGPVALDTIMRQDTGPVRGMPGLLQRFKVKRS
ncbi:flagellar biosynthetic protein FliO [Luteimonas kalidii]|uniref:Flagellar biosynthetic protein FliO n=1 Tax=Luteimonas kalidii TaxID=3042025 RepID=A0ABT6JUU0_9GAMM|nr:flagellar biosynthetic protein FliO [Luteimonas kalidii]MDH5834459.1 flagellar biosynthetic protein FliO [Luteimonas kalidii]